MRRWNEKMEVEHWKIYLENQGLWDSVWERKFAVLSPDKLWRELQCLGGGSSGFGGNLVNQPTMEKVHEAVKKSRPEPDTDIEWIYQHHGSRSPQEGGVAAVFLSALEHLVEQKTTLPEEVFQELWNAMELRAHQLREEQQGV